MRSFAVLWCLCVGLSTQTVTLYAQEPETLAPGMRLRVTVPTHAPKQIVGLVTSVGPSILTIQTSEEVVTVRRDTIHALEFSERPGTKKRGALIGAVVGLLVATIAAAATERTDLLTPEQTLLAVAMVYVPVGTGVGALVAPGEKWAPMPAAAAAPIDTRIQRRGLEMALRLRF